jgi:hypothetical protein
LRKTQLSVDELAITGRGNTVNHLFPEELIVATRAIEMDGIIFLRSERYREA